MVNEYEIWISRQLSNIGLSKAICPHCGNDDQNLMRENPHFTHAHHKALNYQCHNRPHCDKYFQIGPLSDCLCGWDKDETEIQSSISNDINFPVIHFEDEEQKQKHAHLLEELGWHTIETGPTIDIEDVKKRRFKR